MSEWETGYNEAVNFMKKNHISNDIPLQYPDNKDKSQSYVCGFNEGVIYYRMNFIICI